MPMRSKPIERLNGSNPRTAAGAVADARQLLTRAGSTHSLKMSRMWPASSKTYVAVATTSSPPTPPPGRRRPLRRKEARRVGRRSRPSVVRVAKDCSPAQRCQKFLRRWAQVPQGKIDDVLCLLGGEPASALPVVGTLQGQSL